MEVLAIGADEFTVHSTIAETSGDLFAGTIRMPAGGGPPVLHRHAPSEVYHVLEGEFAFYIVDPDGHAYRRLAQAGDTVTLPGNTPHTIRNESDADAVAFCVHAPGGAMEGFCREAARLAADGEPRMEDILQAAARNGIELLGPVPAVT